MCTSHLTHAGILGCVFDNVLGEHVQLVSTASSGHVIQSSSGTQLQLQSSSTGTSAAASSSTAHSALLLTSSTASLQSSGSSTSSTGISSTSGSTGSGFGSGGAVRRPCYNNGSSCPGVLVFLLGLTPLVQAVTSAEEPIQQRLCARCVSPGGGASVTLLSAFGVLPVSGWLLRLC